MSLKKETAVAIMAAIKTSAESGYATSDGLKNLAEAYAAVAEFVED